MLLCATERITKADLPSEADKVARKQLKRLRQMQVGSAEYTVVRTYIDWILDIPNNAGRRAIMMGAAIGAIATGLRVILGLERSHLGAD